MKLLALVLCGLLAGTPLAANFTTEGWTTDIVIAKDRSITVTETISVTFTKPQRGLIRKIPYRNAGRDGRTRTVDFKLVGIKANYGSGFSSAPVSESRSGGEWNLRIGDPDVTHSGRVIYRIAYRAGNALTDFPKDDKLGPRTELYWNVIGSNWATSIAAAKGSITFPKATNGTVAARILVGEYGSTKGIEVYPRKKGVGRFDLISGSFKGNSLQFASKTPLKVGEGITVVLALPKGTLAAAASSRPGVSHLPAERSAPEIPYTGNSEIDEFLRSGEMPKPPFLELPRFEDIATNPVALIPPLLAVSLFYFIARSRFEPKQGPLTVRFEPPDGVGASESGLVLDNTTDPRDVVAGIVSLAQKGAARMQHDQYRAVNVELLGKEKGSDLTRFEGLLYDALEPYGPVVTSEMLRGNFGTSYDALSIDLQHQADQMGLYAGHTGTIRSGYGCLLVGLVVALAGVSCSLSPGYSIIGTAVAIVIGLFMVARISSLTAKGAKVKGEVLGLREFISRAHRRELDYMSRVQPDQALFERLLPYAVAFGLAEQWSQAFDGLDLQPPQWYEGYGGADGLWTTMMLSDLDTFDSTWSNAMTYHPPAPSSWGNDDGGVSSGGIDFGSGDSGFGGGFSSGGGGGGSFDGGGSVGGGGGGGGGDSW